MTTQTHRPAAIVSRAARLLVLGEVQNPKVAILRACREVPSTPADQDSATRAWISLMRKSQAQTPIHPKNPPGPLTGFDRAPHSLDPMPRHKTPTLMAQAAIVWGSLEPEDQQARVKKLQRVGTHIEVEKALLGELMDSQRGTDGVPMLSKLALRTFQDPGLLALMVAELLGHKNPAQALKEKLAQVRAERETGPGD